MGGCRMRSDYVSPIQGWRYVTCNDVDALRENERLYAEGMLLSWWWC